MNYLSVCSGIEAATVAWHHMGWKPVGFSEIEKFPSQVLAHHYPQVTNFGDMTKYKEWKLNDSVGLLVGGTPCQSFSVAGLRKGLDDPRGNLALTYVGILDKFRPKWCVWENVPGVLSSGRGRDFGAFLGALGELGYGWAYRVLDAQNFGVAQRRKRVFVVGCLGGWESAAEVLFESESLSGDIKPSRKTREEAARGFVPSIANCIQTTCNDYSRADGFNMIAHCVDTFPTLLSSTAGVSRPGNAVTEHQTYIAYNIRECAANNTFNATQTDTATTLQKTQPSVQSHHTQTFVAVDMYNLTTNNNTSQTIRNGTDIDHVGGLMQNMAVRRLTPIECERLQGFPDNYTNIKENCPDGSRYRTLGNSMAVPVMRWIGERINNYERI
jgi:DNA (cytosine-5)-methyltransferase 1